MIYMHKQCVRNGPSSIGARRGEPGEVSILPPPGIWIADIFVRALSTPKMGYFCQSTLFYPPLEKLLRAPMPSSTLYVRAAGRKEWMGVWKFRGRNSRPVTIYSQATAIPRIVGFVGTHIAVTIYFALNCIGLLQKYWLPFACCNTARPTCINVKCKFDDVSCVLNIDFYNDYSF